MSKKEKYIIMKKFDVDILPEFANVFLNSEHVSYMFT